MFRYYKHFIIFAIALFVISHFAHSGSLDNAIGRIAHQVGNTASQVVSPAHATSAAVGGDVTVAFSPGDAEGTVVHAIDGASKTIEVAAYSFTSRPIATALLSARERGVEVRIVADKSQRTARFTSVRFLANKGVPVRIDSRYAIMHNKFLVIDGNTVETGSFNFTRAAQIRNAENVIVLANMPQVAATYNREWNRLWGESEPLE